MLFHNVPPKMPGGFAREVALSTVVGLLSGVFPLVSFHRTSFNARIIALIAIEGLFS